MRPLVSVVMPAYNASNYIGMAIYSILNQTLTDLELIVVDDASTDNTREVIQRFKDTRLKFFANRQNQGISENRNIGISNATGKYIAAMDNDDVSLPSRLEMQVKILENNPDVDVVGTGACLIDDNNIIAGFIKKPLTDKEIKKWLFWKNPILSPSIMARQQWFKRWKYRSIAGRIDDHDLFLRAMSETKYENIADYLYCYRIYYKNKFLKKYILAQIDEIKIKYLLCREKYIPIDILYLSSFINIIKTFYAIERRIIQPSKPGIRKGLGSV